jgi:pyruvate dehydrogenase E2 component (dihydrolipoamide acetyltransferase)
MADFVMPILGADMDSGTLVEWKKKPGDRVTKGEIIAEVETDKAAIEIEVFTSGVIEKVLVQPGETVPVGKVMAVIREEGEAAQPVVSPAPTPSVGMPSQRATVSPPTPPIAAAGRLRITPSAKQLAMDVGVDPSSVRGSGPDGAITRRDVEAVAQARGAPLTLPSPLRGEDKGEGQAAPDRQTRMRQTIAAAMARSKREIPHYYLGTTIDLGRAMAWLKEENLKRHVTDRLLYGVLLIKAVALALREVPELNALWKGTEAVRSDAVHVGVAVSLRQGGLIAPALHHTDKQSLTDLMRNLQDLVKRTRAGTLRSSELSDPTITVTNLGEQGVETVYGVIYPPQVALVGFGKVVERPWAEAGQVVARQVVTATLSADHRVTDGHRGGLFLSTLDRLLQEPSRL